jgi:hypothetical protein
VPIGDDGTVTLYSQSGTHLIVDVVGFFTGPGAPSDPGKLFVPAPPSRLRALCAPPRAPVRRAQVCPSIGRS